VRGLISKIGKLWRTIRGEPRDDYVDQFWAFFFRDGRDARPGCVMAGVIVAVLIIIVGILLGAFDQ
jgi:hypothetical protein